MECGVSETSGLAGVVTTRGDWQMVVISEAEVVLEEEASVGQ